MISKGFYFSSKIEKNKGDRDFKARSAETKGRENVFVTRVYATFFKPLKETTMLRMYIPRSLSHETTQLRLETSIATLHM